MKKNSYKGIFIVFEGLDGSGKSVQAKLLEKHLRKEGVDSILTKEPWKIKKIMPPGNLIKKALAEDEEIAVSPKELQGLFAENRGLHLKTEVIPALQKGKIIICDRYAMSSLAFGSADGVSLNSLIELNKNFLEPDLTILLKVSPEICMERIDTRNDTKTRFEKQAHLKKTWKAYKKLAKKFENISIVNGEKSIKKIHKKIKKIIKNKFKTLY